MKQIAGKASVRKVVSAKIGRVRKAERAMRRAKRLGRARIEW